MSDNMITCTSITRQFEVQDYDTEIQITLEESNSIENTILFDKRDVVLVEDYRENGIRMEDMSSIYLKDIGEYLTDIPYSDAVLMLRDNILNRR